MTLALNRKTWQTKHLKSEACNDQALGNNNEASSSLTFRSLARSAPIAWSERVGASRSEAASRGRAHTYTSRAALTQQTRHKTTLGARDRVNEGRETLKRSDIKTTNQTEKVHHVKIGKRTYDFLLFFNFFSCLKCNLCYRLRGWELERSHGRRRRRPSAPALGSSVEFQLTWITHFQQRKICQNTTNIFDLRLVKSTLLDHLSISCFFYSL